MKIIPFIVVFVCFYSTQAQEYKKFRIGLSVGRLCPALPWALSAETSYRINDGTAVGYRFEYASFGNNSNYSSGLFYQYYFLKNKKYFHPFLSLGVGLFTPGDMSGGCGVQTIEKRINTEKKIGFFPSVGFDLGHFSMMLGANLASVSKSTMVSTVPGDNINYHEPYTQYLTNSYVTLKIGFFIGGGRKKHK